MTNPEILELHGTLVRTPSVSGTELQIADLLESWMRSRQWDVRRVGNSVIALYGPGPYLMLNSHLDTVPECDGWTRDPYDVEQVGDTVYGLGSNDAKGAGAAMISAFDHFVSSGSVGSVAIAIVEGEETTGKGMAATLDYFKDNEIQVCAAVIGEPTELDIAVAQKGLLIFEVHATGTPCHAARARELGAINPIVTLAKDIQSIASIEWSSEDPFLGPMSIQTTMISGGTAKNQVPGIAKATFDVRTTNAYSHDEILKTVTHAITGEVELISKRLQPIETSESELIVTSAKQARPESRVLGSSTMSDMVFMRGVPAIKVGPGKSVRSHTADEFVHASEILDGALFYSRLLDNFALNYFCFYINSCW